jgi:hypothetical protein
MTRQARAAQGRGRCGASRGGPQAAEPLPGPARRRAQGRRGRCGAPGGRCAAGLLVGRAARCCTTGGRTCWTVAVAAECIREDSTWHLLQRSCMRHAIASKCWKSETVSWQCAGALSDRIGCACITLHSQLANMEGTRAGSSQWRDFSGQLLALFDALTEAADQGHRIGGLLEVRITPPTAACAVSSSCPASLALGLLPDAHNMWLRPCSCAWQHSTCP